MPDTPDIGFAINLPPENAIEYFERKGWTFSFRWRDTWQQAHAKAFTVAGAMKQDVLSSVREELLEAMQEGKTFRQFQKELKPRLKKLGWWGQTDIVDPVTGEMRTINVTPHRLRTIYKTNMQTSYMAGRYKRHWESRDSRPYWMYVAIIDASTRPSHAAKNQTVLKAEDPWWDANYPPNGFNCRCRVRSLSQRAFDRQNVPLSEGSNLDGISEEGWTYNPGKAAFYDDLTGPDAPKPVKAVDEQPNWKTHGRPDLRDVPEGLLLPEPDMLPRGDSEAEALQIVKQALDLGDDPLEIETPIEKVFVQLGDLQHYVEKRDHARERYANYILPTLLDPYEIYNTLYDDGTFRRRYVGAFEGGGGNVIIVADIGQDGSILYNAIPNRKIKKLNSNRLGALLYAK